MWPFLGKGNTGDTWGLEIMRGSPWFWGLTHKRCNTSEKAKNLPEQRLCFARTAGNIIAWPKGFFIFYFKESGCLQKENKHLPILKKSALSYVVIYRCHYKITEKNLQMHGLTKESSNKAVSSYIKTIFPWSFLETYPPLVASNSAALLIFSLRFYHEQSQRKPEQKT